MQKFVFIIFFLSGIAFTRDMIALSIPMQKEFLQKIAGDSIEAVVLVESGTNPHDFEPKASDVRKVNSAVAYFAIGIEFEEVWLPRFKNQNKALQIFDNDANIVKINFAAEAHNHNHKRDKAHEYGDTHIWLSAKNAKLIAQNIYNSLKQLYPTQDYTESYQQLIAEIDAVDNALKNILSTLPKHQKFVVFHPMLGYFARDYDLEEISIEMEGKSPKAKDMIAVINSIKDEKLHVIFAQPEFSTKSAEFIAKESGAKLGYFSPLQTPWGDNLLHFARTLVELQQEK